MSANGRLCCKSLKTPGDKFPARSRNEPRSLKDVVSGSLPSRQCVYHLAMRSPICLLESRVYSSKNLRSTVQKDFYNAIGTSRHFAAAQQFGRIWSEADINHRAGFMMGWTPPDGIDVPKWRVLSTT